MSDELDALMEELGAVQVSGRTVIDQAREFRQVFMSSDTGKRVLHDILSLGHVWRCSVEMQHPHMTYVNEGERKLALKILTLIHKEPKLPPTKQTTRAPKGDE